MTTRIEIDTAVFNDAYLPLLESKWRVQILFGGSASGKSVFKAQQTILDVLNGGRNYLICRAVARTIRRSVFAEIEKHIRKWGLSHLFKTNKTEMMITAANGYQILFAGLDDVEKLKSITPQQGVITDVWVEEATETQQGDIQQLFKRQRGGSESVQKTLTLTFNPIIQTHWIYKTYFAPNGWTNDQTVLNQDELFILKTTYKNNKFLTTGDIEDLENEPDEYMYNVYTLGNWGVLGNVIFKNFEVCDLSSMQNQFTHQRHGVDWGFGVDPFAFNSTYYDKTRNVLYVFNEFNGVGLSNEQSANAIRPYVGSDPVVCDSAEPKSIADFRQHRINAYGAKKGKGSIEFGYKWLKSVTIKIDKTCINTINEFQLHKWKEDRHGNALPIPEDKNNHHIDEIRYQYEDIAGAIRPRARGRRR